MVGESEVVQPNSCSLVARRSLLPAIIMRMKPRVLVRYLLSWKRKVVVGLTPTRLRAP